MKGGQVFNRFGDIEPLPRAAGLNKNPLINQGAKYKPHHRVDIRVMAG